MTSFTNLTGAAEIGANCYLIKIGASSIVLDAGVHPKKVGNEAKPRLDLLEEEELQAIMITHAHLDHIGALPVLQEKHPRAEVIMTQATAEVGRVMLHNSVNVMMSQRMFDGVAEYPFFSHGELDHAANNWVTRPYEKPFRIGRSGEVLATLYDAGHILGSCGVLLETQAGMRIFYTGDVQFENQSIIPGAAFPEEGVDVLIMECTHGATERSVNYTREREMNRFAKAIRETLQGGGAALIPVFALGKTQELLYELGKMRDSGRIPDVPIYSGGLGAKVTAVYDRMTYDTPRLQPGFTLRGSVETAPLPRDMEGPLRASPGNVYMVSSGMMSPHTLSNKLAAQVLPHPADAILFVGYSDPESPAARIKAAQPGELVRLGKDAEAGQAYPVQCRVESFDFSGHASRAALLDYARRLSPREIVLVHGDEPARQQMRDELVRYMPAQVKITLPEPGRRCRLSC